MKAAVIREHGGPERLVFETDFPDPKPGAGDVIVRCAPRRSTITTSSRGGACPASRCRCR